jgi:branched-chain amino acid transport system ATP-binding protein
LASDDGTILETVSLSKHFGGLKAVEDVSLRVRRGTLTGIIGPNGAGKTTYFNILAGAMRPTSGRVLFEGADVTREKAHRRARRGLARTFQLTRALARMTVRENLMLAPDGQAGEHVGAPLFAAPLVRAQEKEARAKADATLGLFDLAPLADAYAGSLSGGQKKLLELARTLMREPKVVLLDEPMAGVNPTLARKLMDMIERLRRERGITFVLVEHDLEAVFQRCDPIVVMANGRKLMEGPAAVVRADPAVIDAYLGGGGEHA